MNAITKKMLSGIVAFLAVSAIMSTLYLAAPAASAELPHAPGIPDFLKVELHAREIAPLEVALVFGRSKGCDNATPELINLVATEAMDAGVPPKILAATVATESQCTPLAVSNRGALGLTQVMPRIWGKQFDFMERYNLLNPRDNVHVGARIMADLIRQHGLARGVQLYNGAGVGCETCDAGYSSTIIRLAGK